jgi:hypothetical protein
MMITIDDIPVDIQPTGVNWGDPPLLGHNGSGAPVYAPYRTCSLSFDRLTVVLFQQLFRASRDGEQHTVRLPHPENGLMTEYACYVHEFSPRMNVRDPCTAAAAGVDVLLARVEVT